jgi:hypothetical protein
MKFKKMSLVMVLMLLLLFHDGQPGISQQMNPSVDYLLLTTKPVIEVEGTGDVGKQGHYSFSAQGAGKTVDVYSNSIVKLSSGDKNSIFDIEARPAPGNGSAGCSVNGEAVLQFQTGVANRIVCGFDRFAYHVGLGGAVQLANDSTAELTVLQENSTGFIDEIPDLAENTFTISGLPASGYGFVGCTVAAVPVTQYDPTSGDLDCGFDPFGYQVGAGGYVVLDDGAGQYILPENSTGSLKDIIPDPEGKVFSVSAVENFGYEANGVQTVDGTILVDSNGVPAATYSVNSASDPAGKDIVAEFRADDTVYGSVRGRGMLVLTNIFTMAQMSVFADTKDNLGGFGVPTPGALFQYSATPEIGYQLESCVFRNGTPLGGMFQILNYTDDIICTFIPNP